MNIAIITAMPEEFRAVTRGLGNARKMELGSCRASSFTCSYGEVILVRSGMGFYNAARTTETIIREWRPDLLVTTGFCGAITNGLRTGDIVVAKNICIADEDRITEVPVMLSPIGQNFMARQAVESLNVTPGTFISSSVIISKASLAVRISKNRINSVVEMESGAIAIIAAENDIPLLAVRAVSDDAAEELDFSLDDFFDPDLYCIRPHKVFLSILRNPRILPQLLRLKRGSSDAARSLTAAFSNLFPLS